MLGKGLFHIVTGTSGSGGNGSSCQEVSIDENGKIFYQACPDLLIESGRVYFATEGLNASIDELEGRVYAEVMSL